MNLITRYFKTYFPSLPKFVVMAVYKTDSRKITHRSELKQRGNSSQIVYRNFDTREQAYQFAGNHSETSKYQILQVLEISYKSAKAPKTACQKKAL